MSDAARRPREGSDAGSSPKVFCASCEKWGCEDDGGVAGGGMAGVTTGDRPIFGFSPRIDTVGVLASKGGAIGGGTFTGRMLDRKTNSWVFVNMVSATNLPRVGRRAELLMIRRGDRRFVAKTCLRANPAAKESLYREVRMTEMLRRAAESVGCSEVPFIPVTEVPDTELLNPDEFYAVKSELFRTPLFTRFDATDLMGVFELLADGKLCVEYSVVVQAIETLRSELLALREVHGLVFLDTKPDNIAVYECEFEEGDVSPPRIVRLRLKLIDLSAFYKRGVVSVDCLEFTTGYAHNDLLTLDRVKVRDELEDFSWMRLRNGMNMWYANLPATLRRRDTCGGAGAAE